MAQQNGSFQTADGLTIHTEAWPVAGEPRAVVLIVHGLGEHIGRYAHVAAFLNERGYAVYGLDHRGHGKSGERVYFEQFTQPVDDLKRYFDTVKAAHPGKKIFLYAHSLGTLIGLSFLLRHQNEVAGAVISGTPLEVESSQPKLLVQAGGLLDKIAPKMGASVLPTVYLSRDTAVVKAYEADPLVYHGNVRVRMGNQIVQVSREIKARAGELKLPLFIFHGDADKICPPPGSQTLYDRVGSGDKTLKFYSGFFHESHNETEKETVLADIAAWLDTH